MYYLVDGPERAFIKEKMMLIPEDTEFPSDFVQNGDASKISFPIPEQFKKILMAYL